MVWRYWGPAVSDLLLKKLASARCDGSMIDPGHAEYDHGRKVWNGVIDRRPAAILRAANVEDVRRVIDVAARCDAALAVRCGGHSFPGLSTCDGGILLDLSKLNAVSLDRNAGTVDVGGGSLLGDLDKATVPQGYVVPAGVVSHTGVAGLTLGGGMGWISRAYGLTIDSLIGAEIVTATGAVRWVDAESDRELFWGLRGGGGNFCVVTRFRFKLHRLGSVAVGRWTYPVSDARQAIMRLGELARQGERTLTATLTLTSSGLAVTAIWVGDDKSAEPMLSPFGQLAGTGQGTISRVSFIELQKRNDEHFAWARRYYAKGGFWRDIGDHAADAMVEQIMDAPTADSEIYLIQLGGAVADVAEDATAYSGRQAGYYWIVEPVWDVSADDERCTAWGRAAADRMADRTIEANYVNEQADIAIAASAYGTAKYERLRQLKSRLDPTNLFRLNQNILPIETRAR